MEGTARKRRHQLLAAPRANSSAAVECERNIGSKFGSEIHQVITISAQAPQRIAGHERSRRIGTSASHAAGDRNSLVQVHRDVSLDARMGSEQHCCTVGEVRFVDRKVISALARDRQRDSGTRFGVGGLHFVTQAHGMEHGGEFVIAVLAQGADRQLQVHLRGHANDHGSRGHGLRVGVLASESAVEAVSEGDELRQREGFSAASRVNTRGTQCLLSRIG